MAWLLGLTGVYALSLVAITVLNWTSADRYWGGALNFYLPQLLWAVPGVMLTLFILKVDRSWAWLPLLCVLWVLGPIMGCRWSLPAANPPPGALAVRVMTWNIKYGFYDTAPLIDEIERCRPDLVFFQDAVGSMDGPLGSYFKNWQVRTAGQYVIASRFPLSAAEVHELSSPGGTSGNLLHCQARIGPTAISLYNVHFKTPRRSLNAFRTARREPWYLPQAIQSFDHNVRTRILQASSMLEPLSREPGPVIVAGDLNAPDASLACAMLREAGLHDAFAERGKGYGFTYGHFLFKYRLPWLKLSWMRIDHIMASAGFVTRRCWAGSGEASDHRPVIADLVLKNPQEGGRSTR
jgi:vancomycin resistance protein VanJ